MRSAKSTLSCAAIAALAATAAFTGTAAASPTQSFSAHHYDRCLASQTNGELSWRLSPTIRPTAVKVTGYVALRNPQQCMFTARPSAVAVFTAYHGRTVIDSRRERTATGSASFEFVLTQAPTPTPVLIPIDRVTVQVCHSAPATAPTAFTCGAISTYTP